jgi:hypothetical protein
MLIVWAVSYGPNLKEAGLRAARYVDKMPQELLYRADRVIR